MRIYFGQKNPIAVADMFNWLVEAGWDTFWIQGVNNFREELAFYEMLSQLGSDVEKEGSGDNPGATSNPLDLSEED